MGRLIEKEDRINVTRALREAQTDAHQEAHDDGVVAGCPRCYAEAANGCFESLTGVDWPGSHVVVLEPEGERVQAVVFYGQQPLVAATYLCGARKGEPEVAWSSPPAEVVVALKEQMERELNLVCDVLGTDSRQAGEARYRFQQVDSWRQDVAGGIT